MIIAIGSAIVAAVTVIAAFETFGREVGIIVLICCAIGLCVSPTLLPDFTNDEWEA